MRRMSRLVKIVLSTTALAVIVTAGLALTSTSTDARPPGGPGGPPLLCGFTALWTCTLPDGSVVQVAGTQCDIRRFERQTGATCSL